MKYTKQHYIQQMNNLCACVRAGMRYASRSPRCWCGPNLPEQCRGKRMPNMRIAEEKTGQLPAMMPMLEN